MSTEIIYYIFIGIIFIISVSIHEYAHVAAANTLWDPTGKMLWRLTPNPLKHIDPIGFVLIFLIGFWWGRPAPYNPTYFKNPYRDELLVALAGPASNIVLGIFGIIITLIYAKLIWLDITTLTNGWDLVSFFWMQFSLTNFALAAFNLIPLPPLDGYRLIKVINHNIWAWFERNVMRISLSFLILVVFGPFQNFLYTYISWVADFLFTIFMIPFWLLFY